MEGICAAGAIAAEPCLLKNIVSSRGTSNTRLSVLNITVNMVVIIYGIANFSIGLAKDSSRKYVFIKE
jgi:hypothetical protein